MKGIVFNIQRFCTNDGPGIRTTVFLKGCSMHCLWCHNPEGLSPLPQIQYFDDKCSLCGKCVTVCTKGARSVSKGQMLYDKSLCTGCGTCAQNCLNEALSFIGKTMDTQSILKVVKRDMPFYKNSRGGVTFSGGEPLFQKDFLIDLLLECQKNGIHTAVETSLNVPWQTVKDVAEYTDLFFVDIKVMDEKRHKEATGCSNITILENIQKLSRTCANMIIRIPVIGGFNANEEDMIKIAKFISNTRNIKNVEFMPYHNLGTNKRNKTILLVSQDGFITPSFDMLAKYQEIFSGYELTATY